jgi:hypothetical protein
MFRQFEVAEPKAKKKEKRKGPKRSLTAYQYFMKEMAPKMPTALAFGLKAKAVAAIWKGMSVEEKLKFEKLAQKDRERYQQEKAAASAAAGSSSSSSSSSADEPQYTGGLTLQDALDKRKAEAEAKGEVVDLTNDDAAASSAAAASSSTDAKRKVYYVQRFFKNGDPTDEFLKQELDPVELVQNKKLMPTSKKVRSKEDVSYWTPHIQKDFEDGQGFPSKYYVASGWSDADGYHVLASGDAFKDIKNPNKLLEKLLRNFSSGFGPYVEDDPWMGHQEFPIHNEMIIIERQVCRHLNKTARRILFDPSIIEGKNLIHPVVWIEGPPLEKEDEDQAAASSYNIDFK